MKPATRNGLTVLIVALLAVGVGVVFVRHGRTRVAPAVSTTTASPTTASPTTASPTTASPTTATTTTVGTAVPTTTAPPTSLPPTTEAPATGAAAGAGAGAGATTVAPPTTTAPGTVTGPAGDPATIQGVSGEHPHTGRRSLLLPALVLIGTGLAGFRVSRRTRPSPIASRDNR